MRTFFTYFLYNTLLLAASPLLFAYFLRRALRDPRYWRHAGERLGKIPPQFRRTAHGAIWLHAVSVGEVLSAVALIRALRENEPNAPVFVSTTTLAGRSMAEEKLAGLADGVFFAPFDFRFAVKRVLSTLRPSLLIVMETEIWPNLYRETRLTGCSLAVVNGRISDRAMPRYRSWRWFFRSILEQPQDLYVQSAQDQQRYLELGAPAARVRLAGNLKFDFEPNAKPLATPLSRFLMELSPSETWIAASTMPPLEPGDIDEDDAVIKAFQELAPQHPGLLLILAPRRPERFDLAAAKLEAARVPFVRRSNLPSSLELPGVLLLDTMGELAATFAVADVVFVGGSLAHRGGHNIIEPACFGKAIITGPNNQNFAAIHREFAANRAVEVVAEPQALAPAVHELLVNLTARRDMGRRAQVVAESKRGVARRLASALAELRGRSVPRSPQPLISRILLGPLAALWAAGARKAKPGAARLQTPVVSIGGITMGGAGKTPFAIWLSEQLCLRKHRAAILTRGYGRRTPHEIVFVARGMSAPVDLTGDEAQIFVRRMCADIGIGSDRHTTGQLVERETNPDVFVLDDGFQHRKLARDVDIVLIDALDPFGGGSVFPLGRLREPLHKVVHASMFVLTRVEPGRPTIGIREELARINPSAPVFESRVDVRGWKGHTPSGAVAAFCGLGNALTFWETLESLGLEIRYRWSFDDHHRYSPTDLRRLRYWARKLGLDCIVTTEKDVMNLPDGAEEVLRPLKLCWLEISVAVDRPEELMSQVLSQL